MKLKTCYNFNSNRKNSTMFNISHLTVMAVKQEWKNLETVLQWRQKSLNFDKRCNKIIALNSRTKELFNLQELKNEAQWLIKQYFILVSKLVHNHYKNFGEFIVAENIPSEILKIQCWFLESSCARYIAISEIFASKNSLVAGTDGISFTNISEIVNTCILSKLKGSKYAVSTKSSKIKKDLPKFAVIGEETYQKAAKEADHQNLLLKLKLFNVCDLKILQKRKFETNKIKRVWLSKFSTKGFRYLSISTIGDRVLECILESAVHPIVEYQADKYSFAYRPNRSSVQAIILLKKHLNLTGVCDICKQFPVKISRYISDKFKNEKYKCTAGLGKKCSYNYWTVEKNTLLNRSINSSSTNINSKVILVNILKGFEDIKHSAILEKYPLCKKYRYLLKIWLRAFLYSFKNSRDKKVVKRRFKKGLSQGSIIGSAIINVALDGLENILTQGISFKAKKRYLNNLIVVRYTDDIIIMGKGSDEIFYLIINRLENFLNEKGLSISENSKTVIEFMPGKSFTYLGFNFQFVNYNSQRFRKGRLTKSFFNSNTTVYKQRSTALRSWLLITIKREALTMVMQKIRNVLSIYNTGFTLDEIVKRYNNILKELVGYYCLTCATRVQLKFLDFIGYKHFRKLLLKKFSSKPRLYEYISSLYNRNCRVQTSKGESQLKLTDFLSSENLAIESLVSNKKFVNCSNYLDVKVKTQRSIRKCK